MLRIMCKSKIHRARVTKTDLHYEGSIGVDKKLLDAASIYPGEIVQVLNANNGARFETYVIEEKDGSGEIILYGPAARLGSVGDPIIIISKGLFEAKEIPKFLKELDKGNDIVFGYRKLNKKMPLTFRIGNFAYLTDCNKIPESSRKLLSGLDVLVLDALRKKPHIAHFNLSEAVSIQK